jgi:hypothetical protein
MPATTWAFLPQPLEIELSFQSITITKSPKASLHRKGKNRGSPLDCLLLSAHQRRLSTYPRNLGIQYESLWRKGPTSTSKNRGFLRKVSHAVWNSPIPQPRKIRTRRSFLNHEIDGPSPLAFHAMNAASKKNLLMLFKRRATIKFFATNVGGNLFLFFVSELLREGPYFQVRKRVCQQSISCGMEAEN